MAQKIMHVDDNPDTRAAVKLILGKQGYEVVSVASGAECLKRIRQEAPDLILMDMMMPGMTGWNTFLKIKEMKLESTKVAFLTVMPISEEEEERLRKEGIVDYIMKPFTREELVKRTKRITAKLLVEHGLVKGKQ
jgi:CheY-like chemotaxis protein